MSGKELLIEIGCEEIPAGWVDGLAREFAAAIKKGLERERLAATEVTGHSTLRRLVVHGVGVQESQEDEVRDVMGPPWRLAKDPEGKWSRAAAGFARRQGIEEADFDARLRPCFTPRGEYLGVQQVIPGKLTLELLPRILEDSLRSLPVPKAMNWDASIGGKSFSFARPIRWILALFDEQVVPFRIEVVGGPPLIAGSLSRGHRFRAVGVKPGEPFKVDSFASLETGLRQRFVVLDQKTRREMLERRVRELVQEAGGEYAADAKLPQHHNLVEWPGAVLGEYREEFNRLPEEIRASVLVHHQKYFPIIGQCRFVAFTNMPDDQRGSIRQGSERVVLARLEDARFFWHDARSCRLDQRQDSLENVTFHPRIGNLRQKSERIAKLAAWVAGQVGASADHAERAGSLVKCDLTTTLVAEFPMLEGMAGGVLLREEGEPRPVWRAVYDSYRPEGARGALPESPEGAAVSLADRADTLAGLFTAGEVATGSGDPFGLRRTAVGIIRILAAAPDTYRGTKSWPTLSDLIRVALTEYDITGGSKRQQTEDALLAFMSDRLPHVLATDGTIPGAVRAVLAVRGVGDSVAETHLRIRGLSDALLRGKTASLAVACKRIRRIARPELGEKGLDTGVGEVPDPKRFREPAEAALHSLYLQTSGTVSKSLGRSDYVSAFVALNQLTPAVNRFFDEVLVMHDDLEIRRNRIALLSRVWFLIEEVGDLSQIEAAAS